MSDLEDLHKLYDDLKNETDKKINSLEIEVALLRQEVKELKGLGQDRATVDQSESRNP